VERLFHPDYLSYAYSVFMKPYPLSDICSSCMHRNLMTMKLLVLGRLTEAYGNSFVVDVNKLLG
jgi:hypothetical protein